MAGWRRAALRWGLHMDAYRVWRRRRRRGRNGAPEGTTVSVFSFATGCAWLGPYEGVRAVVGSEGRPARGRWRWWFVGLAGLLLLTQFLLGLADGWDLNRTLGVLGAAAIGLSFLLQIRDMRRRASSSEQHEEPEEG